MRPNKEEYMMRLAETASSRSTCDRASVGCVISSVDGHVLSTGYNGSESGAPHCDQVGHLMSGGGCVRTLHAEMNAVGHAARLGISLMGSVAYVTMHPCVDCTKILSAAGVNIVVYKRHYRPEQDGVARSVAPRMIFRMFERRANLVCVEGVGGCGKTTVTAAMESHGFTKFKYPVYDSPSGRLIAEDLKCGGMPELAVQALHLMNKAESSETLSSLMRSGRVVVDRYWPSSMVHGDHGHDDLERMMRCNSMLVQPDVFVLLDVDASDVRNRRAGSDRDRYESTDKEIDELCMKYRRLWSMMEASDRDHSWIVVNGRVNHQDVLREVLEVCK